MHNDTLLFWFYITVILIYYFLTLSLFYHIFFYFPYEFLSISLQKLRFLCKLWKIPISACCNKLPHGGNAHCRRKKDVLGSTKKSRTLRLCTRTHVPLILLWSSERSDRPLRLYPAHWLPLHLQGSAQLPGPPRQNYLKLFLISWYSSSEPHYT